MKQSGASPTIDQLGLRAIYSDLENFAGVWANSAKFRDPVFPDVASRTPAGLTIAQLLGSLNLPTESLAMIFDEIDDFRDAFCLAYTNTHLLAAGQGRLCALLRVREAHWAGDRIVCISQSTKNQDLPKGMLTAAETQELLAFDAKDDCENKDGRTDLYRFAAGNYWRPRRSHNFEYFEFIRKLLPYEKECHNRLVEATGSFTSNDLVLCNLSKREYVRLKALKAATGLPVDKPWLYNRVHDLGMVLLTRICWMPVGSWKHNGGSWDKGEWAGDRFEITTVDAVDARIEKGEAWRGASADPLEDIRAVLKVIYDELRKR
ncbi:hypothetical protein BOTBODRAFT_189787 [Botryobasidium botryosum FD-172 SS1]|uniref:Uncharacterized protein n=1 Tax=Botryobasidium botryosum (strain FD-172 SS1) TaxID=930990 RepID=A0A067MA80_BOTB1|nr:hypothetical protein BOTBODRAFT_189787 [Botryobasidium botryosum FD-172 SS1]